MTEHQDLNELTGRTVLITGGGGLVGSRLALQLRAAGARALLVGRLDAYPPEVYADLFGIDTEHPDTIVGDISDRALMRHTAQKSDYVVHAAAMADVAACTRNPLAAAETNITGTQVLLEEVVRAGRVRRLVFTSSAAVYGNGHGRPGEPVVFSETDTPAPLSVYGNTKLWGEHQVNIVLGAAGIPHTVVRFFSVYGEPQTVKEGSHSWVVAWLAMRAHLGLPLELNGGGHEDAPAPELPVALDMPGKVADFLRAAELDDAERAALDHGVTVRRGQGYTLRVSATPAVHHRLLAHCQPLDGTQGTSPIPAQRKARREYENRVNTLTLTSASSIT